MAPGATGAVCAASGRPALSRKVMRTGRAGRGRAATLRSAPLTTVTERPLESPGWPCASSASPVGFTGRPRAA